MTSARVAPPPGRPPRANPGRPDPPPGPASATAATTPATALAAGPGPPRPEPRRGSSCHRPRSSAERIAVSRSGLTRLPANRSNIVVPTSMCWNSGTGRCSVTTTSWLPRTSASQSPNSSALLTVAERR